MAYKTKWLINERHCNNTGRWYTITGYPQNNRRRYIKFDSGYECCALITQLKNGKVKDLYEPTYYNIACAGMDYATEHFLFNRWANMIGRCYNENHSGYKSYGAKGVTVSPELLVFKNYVEIVEKLPNYQLLLENPKDWDIDKDYKSKEEKIYSKDTICIMKKYKNIELENESKKIKIQQFTLDNKYVETFESISLAEKITGIHKGNIAKVVRGESKSAGGYIWRKYYDTEF